MESFNCSIGNCSLPSGEYCDTCSKVFCKNHSHSTVNSHITYPITKLLDSSEKSKISQLASWAIKKSSSLRKDVLTQTKTLIDQINQESAALISKLDYIISQAFSLASLSAELESVVLYRNQNKDQEVLVEYFTNNYCIKSFIELEDFRVPIIEKILGDRVDFFVRPSSMQNSISKVAFFKKDSKTLVVYNVKTNKLEKKETKIMLGDRAGWCYLPEGSVFHCGGRVGKNNTGFACIINPNKLTVEPVKSSEEMRNVGQVTYHKGEVYVFGGFNKGSNLRKAFKYNLLKDNWIKLADLPSPSEDCSSCSYGKSIIVTGFNLQGILEYDRDSNSYSLLADLPIEHKIVWSAFGRCFCLAHNAIFETNLMELTTWTSYYQKSIQINQKRLLAPTFRRGNDIYILFENRHLYKFNLLSRSFSLLEVIPDF